MLKYILKRIVYFVPTLLAISLLTFFISVNAPGDPVDVMLNSADASGGSRAQNASREKDYEELRHKLGLDRPLFYFSLTDKTVTDTLHRISDPDHRKTLKRLSDKYGNWGNVSSYYINIRSLEASIYNEELNTEKDTHSHSKENLVLLKVLSDELCLQYEEAKVLNVMEQITKYSSGPRSSSPLQTQIHVLGESLKKMISEKDPYTKYIPALHWHGLNNQYHRWISDFMAGNFGISYQDKRNVSEVVLGGLGKTVGISILSILLAYLIAIPLGVHSAVKKGTRSERSITTTLFMLYSLPNFWIATMLVVFLCGGDYFSWFPSPGSPPIPEDAPFWYKLSEGTYRMILPLFCWTYGSLAFISRQMRGGILSSISQDYIQTARAKGLDEKQIIRHHALKNSLLPVITLFSSIFPLAISGSFVIENIFNISGMGKLSLEALYARDYPVIFTIMMFTAILTMLGNLLGDIFYAFADPRISFSESK